jgi:antitoxin (DNA-binding transcriptional repressor) of toxin-antitoxin stability system
MRIPLAAAAEKLDELVDRAVAGEEIVLLLDGQEAARLVPTQPEAKSEDGGDRDRL